MAVIKRIARVANPAKRRARRKSTTSTARRRRARASAGHRKRSRVKLARAANGRFLKRASAKRKKRATARHSAKRRANPRKAKRVSARKTARRSVRRSRPARRKAAVRAVANPVRRRKAVKRRRPSARRNPAPVMVTLGYLNPSKKTGEKKMARRKSRTHSTRRRANSRRRHTRRARRNPSFSGISSQLQTGIGVLLGVTATKLVTGMVPASLTGTPIMRLLASAAATVVINMGAKRFAPSLAQGMLYGGMAQTAAIALNAFVPSVGGRLVPAGLGDLIPGNFVVPQNPVSMPLPAVTSGSAGVGAAFGRAF